MDINRQSSEKSYRPEYSWLIVVWRWAFNLSIFGLLLWVLFNRYELAIYTRLAPNSSLTNHFFWLITAVIFILFLTSTFHELGHLVAGKWANLQFQLLIVGPIRIARHGEKVRLEWHLNGSLFNGLAASIPEDDLNLTKRMLLFAAGGPIASLILMILAISIAFYMQLDLNRQLAAMWIWESALFTAVVSYFFFLTSIKPGTYQNGLPADGARIAMLVHGGRQADRWCHLVRLNSLDIFGQRPKDWPEDKVIAAVSFQDNSHDHLTALILAYQWARDRENWDQAENYLDEALDMPIVWIAGMRARLALEKAYVEAIYKKDEPNARQWLNQIRRSKRAKPQQLRAEASVCLVAGDIDVAKESASQAQHLLQEEDQTGVISAEKMWLGEIIESANKNS